MIYGEKDGKNREKMWVVFVKDDNENILISLLTSRKGTVRIKEYVEQMWFDRFLSFKEKLYFLYKRKALPYKAKKTGYNNIPSGDRIICGDNGMEIWAINSFAHTVDGGYIEIDYRLPSKFDWEKPEDIEWKYFSVKIKDPADILK
jgi:hypothetical protein